MICNIINDCWDDELLNIFDIPKEILPEIKNSMDDFGVISSNFFGSEIPICGVAGDQQAAAFGQLCNKKGMIKSTYGTGCFMLMNTGSEIYQSQNKLLSTTAFKVQDKKLYALEGSIFNAGTTVQWMRDELSFFEKSEDIEDLASKIKFYSKNDKLRKEIGKNGKAKYFKLFDGNKISKYIIDISLGRKTDLFK